MAFQLIHAITDSMYFWLFVYFATNLGLTIYNKAVLQFANFHFPFLLTGIHCLFSCVGAFAFVLLTSTKRDTYASAEGSSRRGTLVLLGFSVLYTINIAMSNISLDQVTLAFHQLVRSTTPFFAVIISLIFRIQSFSFATYLSLIPVVMGVIMATYGDISFTAMGFFLTVLGTFLAAIKTIVTNIVLVGSLKLQPMDLLWRMSFLAFFQCAIFGYATGEWEEMLEMMADADWSVYAILAGNGVMAFLLNYASFTTNKLSSALTMTVAANVKQVLTIILAVIVFSTPVNMLNAMGIIITLAGGAQYTLIEYRETEERKKQQQLPLNNTK